MVSGGQEEEEENETIMASVLFAGCPILGLHLNKRSGMDVVSFNLLVLF